MLNDSLKWFYITFGRVLRQGNVAAFELLMFLSLAHFFGFYNPKQLADYLGIGHQNFYKELKNWSLYQVKKMLVQFMVNHAVEQIKSVLSKSDATKSRAGMTLSVDNSVIDRLGRMLRCVWSWYSGRAKKVVKGQDLLGITLTINGQVIPLHLLFVSKQGRANTNKPELLISMLKELIDLFKAQGIDITAIPITMDSWYVSNNLSKKLHELGFTKIILAGKGNYTFRIGKKKQKASFWKKEIKLIDAQWGVDVPAKRVKAKSPTFGEIVLFFYKKSTTRNYYLMDFSKKKLRSAEIWSIWKQHFLIECFWKILKSTLKIKEMRLRGNGLYTALLIKILTYLLALRIKRANKAFSNFSITQIMRKIRAEYDLKKMASQHFHLNIIDKEPIKLI